MEINESIKAAAYLGLFHPKYASAIWDLHLSKDINAIEKLQRIAARWVNQIIGRTVCQTCYQNCCGQHYLHVQL